MLKLILCYYNPKMMSLRILHSSLHRWKRNTVLATFLIVVPIFPPVHPQLQNWCIKIGVFFNRFSELNDLLKNISKIIVTKITKTQSPRNQQKMELSVLFLNLGFTFGITFSFWLDDCQIFMVYNVCVYMLWYTCMCLCMHICICVYRIKLKFGKTIFLFKYKKCSQGCKKCIIVK